MVASSVGRPLADAARGRRGDAATGGLGLLAFCNLYRPADGQMGRKNSKVGKRNGRRSDPPIHSSSLLLLLPFPPLQLQLPPIWPSAHQRLSRCKTNSERPSDTTSPPRRVAPSPAGKAERRPVHGHGPGS
jgi:hypothetical protein